MYLDFQEHYCVAYAINDALVCPKLPNPYLEPISWITSYNRIAISYYQQGLFKEFGFLKDHQQQSGHAIAAAS